jgi:hypothetical protein
MRARQFREIIAQRAELFDDNGFAEHHLQVK